MNYESLDFVELLSDIVPADKRISGHKMEFWTSPGRKSWGMLCALDITLEETNPKKEIVHTVVKCLPSNEFAQKYVRADITFRNELMFYETILPTLKSFHKQHTATGLEFFPKFYPGRLSTDSPKTSADENSLIVLENLKVAGFTNFNKRWFDLETTKFILTKVSEFHGTVLALKETQPEVFAEKVLPHFEEFQIFQMDPNVANDGLTTSEKVVNAIMEIVEKDDFCSRHIDRIRNTINTCIANLSLPKNAQKFRKDVFACPIHADLRMNNIMVKFQEDRVVDLKIIDWQLIEYASVVKDLIYFLGTSVNLNILMREFDSLMDYYYDSLIRTLEKLKCFTEKFTYDVFQEELKRVTTEVAYFHMIGSLPLIIMAEGQKLRKSHKLSKKRMLNIMQVSEACAKRVCCITKSFIMKGWM